VQNAFQKGDREKGITSSTALPGKKKISKKSHRPDHSGSGAALSRKVYAVFKNDTPKRDDGLFPL
jgi:hypothetical protein